MQHKTVSFKLFGCWRMIKSLNKIITFFKMYLTQIKCIKMYI